MRTTLTVMATIEQLERDVWPDSGPDDTSLIRRCTELRRKPVAEFTVEDLRIMLGQQIGVSVLLPLAVQVLLRDPLAEGDYYPGDLLRNVLRLPDSEWSRSPSRTEASGIGSGSTRCRPPRSPTLTSSRVT